MKATYREREGRAKRDTLKTRTEIRRRRQKNLRERRHLERERGREGKGREGKGREGKGREGREGKGREGREREGKGREREGKGREGKGVCVCVFKGDRVCLSSWHASVQGSACAQGCRVCVCLCLCSRVRLCSRAYLCMSVCACSMVCVCVRRHRDDRKREAARTETTMREMNYQMQDKIVCKTGQNSHNDVGSQSCDSKAHGSGKIEKENVKHGK